MNKKLLLPILLLSLVVGCHKENLVEIDSNGGHYTPESETTDGVSQIKGLINVKFNRSIIDDIDSSSNLLIVPTGSSILDEFMNQLGADRLKRVFPYSGKYEHMQVNQELHLWYTISFDPQQQTRAVDLSGNSPIVDFSENVYRPKLNSYRVVKVENRTNQDGSVSPFNDPLFYKQWNLYNDGTIGQIASGNNIIQSSLAGADINIIPAWEQSVGSPKVIVSVVDGGVDLAHEDLVANLWINGGEIPNNGIDDDNNGYVDDVNGYNFVDDSGVILPHDHGVHVAGVIAASNDNGVGISGIAGGDHRANSGAKIMSCQIFKVNPNYDPDDENSSEDLTTQTDDGAAAAIVYGANNGAVISQNSWGYGPMSKTPKVIAEAIAYFRRYAGVGDNGVLQDESSLMQGGVVIFAAGNDQLGYESAPSADPGVISVSAYAPDFAASWYTNYGDWVSLAAPGGWMALQGKYSQQDGEYTSAILSTISGGRYGYMQGTSMACPHVSGIAALIVSKYGGMGFTRDQLEQRLLTGIKSINPNNFVTSRYHNKMGRGFVDAHVALVDIDESSTPAIPEFVEDEMLVDYRSVTLAFKASSSEVDQKVDSYTVYLSDRELTPSNYNLDDSAIHISEVVASYYDSSKHFVLEYTGLKQGVKYYSAIESRSRNGNRSQPVFLKDGITTLVNNSPEIKVVGQAQDRYTIAGNDKVNVRLKVSDVEGHSWNFKTTFPVSVESERDGDYIDLVVSASKFSFGEHTITTTVTDEHMGISDYSFVVVVTRDNPPYVIDPHISLDVMMGEVMSFDLSALFEDEEPMTLSYNIDNLERSNCTVKLNGTYLEITPIALGQNHITITVKDRHDLTVTQKIPIYIYNNGGIYSLYPTPTQSNLYVRIAEHIEGPINVEIRNVIGVKAYSSTYHTDNISESKRTLLINVGSFFPGKYEFIMTNNNKTYNETFIKK